MLRDLRAAEKDQQITVDVCIIGAGPAGLALARALTERNVQVALIERGPAVPVLPSEAERPLFTQREYKGANLARAFGLGGTSVLWGGQLLPLRAEEMRFGIGDGAQWPIDYEALIPYYERIESWCGVGHAQFDVSADEPPHHPFTQLNGTGFSPRFSKWLPFRRRNLALAWLPMLERSGKAQIWFNAEVCGWKIERQHDVMAVRSTLAYSDAGHRLEVRAPRVVICAGTIESARLALELWEQATGSRGAAPPALGGFLQDHLSIRIGELRLKASARTRARFMSLFTPFFVARIMRSLRLDLPPEDATRESLPPAYAHLAAVSPEGSAFASVRDMLRSLQARRMRVALRHAVRLMFSLPELIELLYWRVVHRRLIFSRSARLYINMDFEQPRLPGNRVSLSDEKDTRGRRRVTIAWNLPEYPARLVESMQQRLRTFWAANQLQDVAELELLEPADIAASMPDNLYDIYHPSGTTRMGSNAEQGAVDGNLQLFGIGNAYVLSTSVFPSIGAANPTFTLLALSLRLADHLLQQLTSHQRVIE